MTELVETYELSFPLPSVPWPSRARVAWLILRGKPATFSRKLRASEVAHFREVFR